MIIGFEGVPKGRIIKRPSIFHFMLVSRSLGSSLQLFLFINFFDYKLIIENKSWGEYWYNKSDTLSVRLNVAFLIYFPIISEPAVQTAHVVGMECKCGDYMGDSYGLDWALISAIWEEKSNSSMWGPDTPNTQQQNNNYIKREFY